MSDRIDELESLGRQLTNRMHLRVAGAQGDTYMMPDNQVSALLATLTELAAIARKNDADADKWRKVSESLAEALVVAGWCRPDGERGDAPCQEDGETCVECAYTAAREAVQHDAT